MKSMKPLNRQSVACDPAPVRTQPLPWELPGAYWIAQEELTLVSQVVKARSPFRYYGLDPQHMVDQLEEAFRSKLNRQYALGVNSATAGLHIALCSLDVGPGDEVLLPGYLWASCLSAIVRLGAIPRLVDIDETFCMSPHDLRQKIGPHSKAILLVHMSGAPGRADEIQAIARNAGLPLVEDCAQSVGASLHGKQTGTFGDLAVFSFQLNKNMTSGEGGMIVCNDESLYQRCFALHDLGYVRNKAGRLDPANEQYQCWGIGSRMSELAGAMALAQFRKLPRITESMRQSKWAIRRQLEGLPGLGFREIIDPAGDSGPFLITIYRDSNTCRTFTAALQEEGIRGPDGSFACLTMKDWGLHWYFNNPSLTQRRGVNNGGWPWTMAENAFAKDYSYGRGTLPVCDDLADRSAILAIASCLNEQDIQDIVAAFHKVVLSGITG